MATPLSKSKRNLLSQLSSKKMREKHEMFLIEGSKSISDFIDNCGDKYEMLYVIVSSEVLAHANSEIERIRQKTPEIFTSTQSDLKAISSLSTAPDMIAVCRLPERRPTEEILAERLPAGLYLLLDGIQDPGNLGTIIRTAHWFGVSRIFASPETADIFNPKVVKSTMGSMGAVSVEYVDLPQLCRANPDIPVAGLQLEGEDIFKANLPESTFIVMGNEGNGLTQEMRDVISLSLTIPPADSQNHAESLNVAIATAITLAQFKK